MGVGEEPGRDHESLFTSRHWQWDGPVRLWIGVSFQSMILGVSLFSWRSFGVGLGPLYFGVGGYGDTDRELRAAFNEFTQHDLSPYGEPHA